MDEDYKKTGLAIALIGCLSCLYFIYLIYYLQCSAELNFDYWDCMTITTSDFTCQVTFPEAVWLSWKDKVRKEKALFRIDDFKDHFQAEIERQVNELPVTTKACDIRVSSIHLAYDN